MQIVVVMVDGTDASPRAGGDGGGGKQAGPGFDGPRQPHAAGVPSSPGFPDTLDGLCTGHLSSSLVNLMLRGEAVCRSQTGGSRWTSDGIKCAKTSG